MNIPKTSQAEHHIHKRKKRKSKEETTLHQIVDKLVYIAGPLIPVAVAPQAYSIWADGAVEGISLFTWGVLTGTSTVMATYAFIHRDKALMLTYTPLVFLNASVVVGVIVNR